MSNIFAVNKIQTKGVAARQNDFYKNQIVYVKSVVRWMFWTKTLITKLNK